MTITSGGIRSAELPVTPRTKPIAARPSSQADPSQKRSSAPASGDARTAAASCPIRRARPPLAWGRSLARRPPRAGLPNADQPAAEGAGQTGLDRLGIDDHDVVAALAVAVTQQRREPGGPGPVVDGGSELEVGVGVALGVVVLVDVDRGPARPAPAVVVPDQRMQPHQVAVPGAGSAGRAV